MRESSIGWFLIARTAWPISGNLIYRLSITLDVIDLPFIVREDVVAGTANCLLRWSFQPDFIQGACHA
jgi:hypothetical protein